MMYWTTTGIFESIGTRNDRMWEAPNVKRLREMWEGGMQEFVDDSNPFVAPPKSTALAVQRRRYMPNIVMIDFADKPKCKQIRALNDLAASDFVALESGL